MTLNTRPPDMERYIIERFDDALSKGWIEVFVQPVVRTLTRQVCGMEALARWRDPEYGLLMPCEFIGVLEKHRRIHEMDTYVVRKVCEAYRLGRVRVPVSVNLSRLDYELCDIFEVVESLVKKNRVPRDSLCIEITESVLASSEALMRQYIDRFRSAGYPVWMDDFGSGYSSLNVLKDFMFDELKIDMRFLSDFHPRSRKIVASIINMAKLIDIQTLAEGVETEEQFEFLRNLGCEKIQGFLFSRPMPLDALLRHVNEKGFSWESPNARHYCDDIGRLNVLSATPFQFPAERTAPITGREMNSIPLAIMELRGEAAQVLFTNRAFDETAPVNEWSILWNRPVAPEGIPVSRLPHRLAALLEEARAEGQGKLLTVYNDEYYEVRTRRAARHGDTCAILLGVTNLSKAAALDNQRQLDEGLRSLYTVFERVTLINLKNLTAIPLYMNGKALETPTGNLKARMEEYAEQRVFPEDRQRFMRFMRPDTLEQRVAQAGGGSVSIHLRTLTFHGAYAWKCYMLVRIRENIYYLLVRDAAGEVRELRSAYAPRGDAKTELTPELLWENVVNHASLKFFWKDLDRRFVGASRSFLDHYEFDSPAAIVGRTDEDMGWHIHPDLYRNEELAVLHEGVTSMRVEGACLVQGESQDIVATKMPLYNSEGEIVGLIGQFAQTDTRSSDKSAARHARGDELTGLLNSRGISEDLYAYIDEYQLRGQDFARIEVAIDDFADFNTRFGYDFGDAVIRETGRALLHCCGNAATVGRFTGCIFTVLKQFEDPAELDELIRRIRQIPAGIRQIDGTPFNLYLSVGMALYSETRNKEVMAAQAELRRLTDDVEGISKRQLMENTNRIFQMFDELPLSYAVYKVLPWPDGIDAILLYANRKYMEQLRPGSESLVGRRMSRLDPAPPEQWYALAAKAGLEEKTLVDRIYYPPIDRDLTVHVHPIIGPGFCAFTYQPVGE